VQELLKRTEQYQNIFENYGEGTSADRSKLPNYKVTSLSPLRYAHESAPQDFQVLMDERNRQIARKFHQGLLDASQQNGNLAKIKALEERTKHLETLLTEQEALSHDNHKAHSIRQEEINKVKEKKQYFHQAISQQIDMNAQHRIMKELGLTPGEFAMNKEKIMGLPISKNDFIINKAAGVKI